MAIRIRYCLYNPKADAMFASYGECYSTKARAEKACKAIRRRGGRCAIVRKARRVRR